MDDGVHVDKQTVIAVTVDVNLMGKSLFPSSTVRPLKVPNDSAPESAQGLGPLKVPMGTFPLDKGVIQNV